MKFTLIVPPTYETEITGFVGAGEKHIGSVVWRAEIYRGQSARITRNGQPINHRFGQRLGDAVSTALGQA